MSRVSACEPAATSLLPTVPDPLTVSVSLPIPVPITPAAPNAELAKVVVVSYTFVPVSVTVAGVIVAVFDMPVSNVTSSVA